MARGRAWGDPALPDRDLADHAGLWCARASGLVLVGSRARRSFAARQAQPVAVEARPRARSASARPRSPPAARAGAAWPTRQRSAQHWSRHVQRAATVLATVGARAAPLHRVGVEPCGRARTRAGERVHHHARSGPRAHAENGGENPFPSG
jgi:hypothetical protein